MTFGRDTLGRTALGRSSETGVSGTASPAAAARLVGSRSRTGTLKAITAVYVTAKLSGSRIRSATLDAFVQVNLPPDNDPFAGAIALDAIDGDGGAVDYDTTYATTEEGEPDWTTLSRTAENTLWYSYTAAEDGELRLFTTPTNTGAGPYLASCLGVYEGAAFGALTVVSENDHNSAYDPVGSASFVSVALAAGQTVMIRVGPRDISETYVSLDDPTANVEYAVGPGALSWDFEPTVAGGYLSTGQTDGIYTPGVLDVTMGNLAPSATVNFSIDSPTGDIVDTLDVDETGSLTAASVIVPDVLPAGDHTLFGHVSDGSSFQLVFTVLDQPSEDAADGDDVPPVLIPRSGVKRWIFQDPTGTHAPNGSASYVVPINPQKMNEPLIDKQISTQTAVGVAGQPITWESAPQAPNWGFSGVILDGDPRDPTSHKSMLEYFLDLPYLIYVIDHFNRAWTVYLNSFKPVPAQTVQHMNRWTYDMAGYVFGKPTLL